jgi:ActR/RegA family two-component response regulator
VFVRRDCRVSLEIYVLVIMATVLIVDDDPKFVRECAAELTRRKVEHTPASSVESALARLETTRITAAIVKVQLADPEKRLWRALEKKRIPVAAVSDIKQEPAAATEWATKAHAAAYVEKPVNMTVLITALLASAKPAPRSSEESEEATLKGTEPLDTSGTVLDVKLAALNALQQAVPAPSPNPADSSGTVLDVKLAALHALQQAVPAPSTAPAEPVSEPTSPPRKTAPAPAAPAVPQAPTPSRRTGPHPVSPTSEPASPPRRTGQTPVTPAAEAATPPRKTAQTPAARAAPEVVSPPRRIEPAPAVPAPVAVETVIGASPPTPMRPKPEGPRPSRIPSVVAEDTDELDLKAENAIVDPLAPPNPVPATGSGARLAAIWTMIIIGIFVTLFARKLLADTPEDNLAKVRAKIMERHQEEQKQRSTR